MGGAIRYITVSVLLKDDHNGAGTKQETICLANIIWLREHEYKCWFGGPVEEWRKCSPEDDTINFSYNYMNWKNL